MAGNQEESDVEVNPESAEIAELPKNKEKPQKTATAKKVELNVEEKPGTTAPQNTFVSIHNMYQQTSARLDRRKPSNFLRMSTVTISTKRQKKQNTRSEFTDEPQQRRKKSLPGEGMTSLKNFMTEVRRLWK